MSLTHKAKFINRVKIIEWQLVWDSERQLRKVVKLEQY
jgi:hypothetical protein